MAGITSRRNSTGPTNDAFCTPDLRMNRAKPEQPPQLSRRRPEGWMVKALGSLFALAGETLSAIGRMIERPAFNDEAAEEYLSESAVINKVTFDTLQATREHDLHWSGGRNGRMESDGPDAADVLADFEARTEVHEPKFCQHCNSYGIHLRSCSTSPGASSVSQPAAAAVPGEAVGAVESPSSGDGADWPLGELLKESGRLLWAYGIGEASEYTMHLAMQLRTAALRISDTE